MIHLIPNDPGVRISAWPMGLSYPQNLITRLIAPLKGKGSYTGYLSLVKKLLRSAQCQLNMQKMIWCQGQA